MTLVPTNRSFLAGKFGPTLNLLRVQEVPGPSRGTEQPWNVAGQEQRADSLPSPCPGSGTDKHPVSQLLKSGSLQTRGGRRGPGVLADRAAFPVTTQPPSVILSTPPCACTCQHRQLRLKTDPLPSTIKGTGVQAIWTWGSHSSQQRPGSQLCYLLSRRQPIWNGLPHLTDK